MTKLTRSKILIVDDDSLVLEALNQVFLDDYDVMLASTGEEALDLARRHPDIDAIVLDIRMAPMGGLETAEKLKAQKCEAPIIFNTGFPGDYSRERVTREQQPFEYTEKSEGPQRLQRAVQHAVEFTRLKRDPEYLTIHAREKYNMVGKSRAMRENFLEIEQVARTDSKVMVFGETGTGKGMVARAIHDRSPRVRYEFHTLTQRNAELIESELFGHVRGAFTTAVADRVGLFEFAHGGTIFLDEIADLDLGTQSKLLRVLESGEFQRIGSPQVHRTDVRIICATNRNLEKHVETGQFRQDLYYRLKGVTIYVPPLRERPEDIRALVEFFTDKHCAASRIEMKYFDQASYDLFLQYDWPGNVREMAAIVQSAIDSTPSYLITRDITESALKKRGVGLPVSGSLKEQLRSYKRMIFIRGLDRHQGNVASLARELRVDAANLRKLITKFDIPTS